MPHVGKMMRRFLAVTCACSCSVPFLAAPTARADTVVRVAASTRPLPQRGDHSADVEALQRRLIAAGIPVTGGADGSFGPATARAVARFQATKGLPATGRVDHATAVAVGLRPSVALLTPGSTGAQVATVQRRLIAVGLRPKGGADGRYGPSTADSVRQFQSRVRIPATGKVDSLTAALLSHRARTTTDRAAPPASPTSAPSSSVLAPGSTGDAVRTVQRRLAAVGARPRGGVDGVYGPATVAAVSLFQRWNGIRATGLLDARTAAALAEAAAGATALRLAHFPLPRTCMFWDTWGAPRSGGRRHEGTDIFARRGTPIYAVADGRITRVRADFPGSRGGNQLWLTARDGTKYFYGHLDGFHSGIGPGVPVRAGDVLGTAGSTGLTSAVHLHFEVHPGGRGPVNPYPILVRSSSCRTGS